MSSYIIRGIDPAIWEPFKARALEEGRGLKYVLLRLCVLYAKAGLAPLEKAASAAPKQPQ